MKKFILILSLVLIATVANAYLIDEGFEGTGTPSGWFIGQTGAGVKDPDYATAPAPLYGSQSLFLDSGVTGTATATYLSGGAVNNSEIWGKYVVNISSYATGFNSRMPFLNDSASAEQVHIFINPTRHTLEIFDNIGGAADVETTDALSLNTTYDVFYHYKAGSGTNGIMEASFVATGGARPNSGGAYATFTTGHFTANIAEISFKSAQSQTAIFDNVQVCDTDCFAGATPTATATFTPTATATATFTPTPSATFTPTPVATATFTPTATPSATFTPTPTAAPTATFTPTPTSTPQEISYFFPG